MVYCLKTQTAKMKTTDHEPGSERQIDPRVARFLRIHSVSIEEEIEADVADARDLSPAERWRILEALSGTSDWLAAANPPEFVGKVLGWRDPPHPSYFEIVARLRKG